MDACTCQSERLRMKPDPGKDSLAGEQVPGDTGALRGLRWSLLGKTLRRGGESQEGALNRHRRRGEFRGGGLGLPHPSSTSSSIPASGIPAARGDMRPPPAPASSASTSRGHCFVIGTSEPLRRTRPQRRCCAAEERDAEVGPASHRRGAGAMGWRGTKRDPAQARGLEAGPGAQARVRGDSSGISKGSRGGASACLDETPRAQ